MALVILDRDGVINQDSDQYVKSADEWIAYPDSLAAIAALNRAGIKVAVASNQSGLGRGYFAEADLHAMHDKLDQALANVGGHLDALVYCPHRPDEGCACRKPLPGMLITLLEQLNEPADTTWFVGDSASDIDAGQAAGCATALVLTGKGERTWAKADDRLKRLVRTPFPNLAQFVDSYLNHRLL